MEDEERLATVYATAAVAARLGNSSVRLRTFEAPECL
jgi:hypothetical protein